MNCSSTIIDFIIIMWIFNIQSALIEDVGSIGAMKSSTGLLDVHRLSENSLIRLTIVLKRSGFTFLICSETVNPFPELVSYRHEIIWFRVSRNMDFFRVCNSKWREGERKRNIWSVIIHSNRRSNVYGISFSRIFVVLSLATNFSLEVSFCLCDSKGNRIGWGTWMKKEKNQEKTFQHSI